MREGNNAPRLGEIETVTEWLSRTMPKIPSEITYSEHLGRENWGFGIGSNALVIRWTKLDLEAPSLEKALENMKQTISEARQLYFESGPSARNRRIPHHLTYTSEDVMRDYLEQVFLAARNDIKAKKGLETLELYPLDLVMTHPVVCVPLHPR